MTFMSGGEIGDVAAVEHLLGRRIDRVDVPGFSHFAAEGEDGAPSPALPMPVDKKAERASRGRKLGKKTGAELTPEELQRLLKVG
jgi:ATP-dependent RNA helicase RhlE